MKERLKVLARVARRDPREAWDRVHTAVLGRLDARRDRPGHYAALAADVIPSLLRSADVNAMAYVNDRALAEIEAHVRSLIPSLESGGPFNVSHNADLALARIAYLLARASRPAVIVETGVAYGVSTAFLLRALRENGTGALHSVDLPPLADGADIFIGYLVPSMLWDPWTLHRGSVRRLLPDVLRRVGRVDLFLHDSLHTRRHMLWEFETVRPFLHDGSIVLSDDVGGNTAFSEWTRSVEAPFCVTFRVPDKGAIAGLAVL